MKKVIKSVRQFISTLTFPRMNIFFVLALILFVIIAVVFIYVVLPGGNSGVVSVRVEAGKMACLDKIPLIDINGKVVAGINQLKGTPELMAYSTYQDAKLEKGPKGVTYTFLGKFEEVIRVDKNTGRETSKTVSGTYRYCFVTTNSVVPGTYDVLAQVSFYKTSSEDAMATSVITIPYKLEVIQAKGK